METAPSHRPVVPALLIVSALVLAFLFWLIYFKPVAETTYAWVGWLPQLNAALNFTSFCLVLGGIHAIYRGNKRRHVAFMVGALVASALFLLSYVAYHHFHGHSVFTGEGWIRPVYFFILISHIVLSVVLVPLLLITVAFAAWQRYDAHRKIARWTFPIWLYVSITGVMVFLILRGFHG